MYPAGEGRSSFHFPPEGQTVEEVEVWTLDRFDAFAGRRGNVLLWMDTEGAELEAIAGGSALLGSGRVRWINVETRDAPVPGHPTTREVSAALGAYGYRHVRRYNVQGDYPEVPGDTIYFASGEPVG